MSQSNLENQQMATRLVPRSGVQLLRRMRLALRRLLCQGFMEVSFNKGPWGTNNRNVDVHMPVRLESVIMEMQWDVSYDWNVQMNGYRFSRKNRQGSWEGGVALHVSEQLENMELRLKVDEELTESLWVRNKGRSGTGDIIAGIFYRWPVKEGQMYESLYRQIGAASHSWLVE